MNAEEELLQAFHELNQKQRSGTLVVGSEESERWASLRAMIERILIDSVREPSDIPRNWIWVPVSSMVRYRTQADWRERYALALGDGGAILSTIEQLAPSTPIELELFPTESEAGPLKLEGRVMWCLPSEDPAAQAIGVAFEQIKPADREFLYRWLDENLSARFLERRSSTRVHVRLVVGFGFADASFEDMTDNLTPKGMFLVTDNTVPLGERMRLVLHLPGNRPAIQIMGEVVQEVLNPLPGHPKGLGVAFVDLRNEDREAIRQFLAEMVISRGEEQVGSPGRPPRAYVRLERRIKARYQSANSFGLRYLRDISQGGMFLQTRDPPALDGPIEITLIHPVTLKLLPLTGRVTRVVEYDPDKPNRVPGIGVVFDAVTQRVENELQDFLRYYARLEDRRKIRPDDDPAGAEPNCP